MRRLAFATVVAALGAWALPSRAEPTEQDKATALTLFKRGRELMAAGNVDEACESFAQSQRLDPGGGTLLNLAVCHEEQGRTATAWAEYSDALALARRDQRPDRIELATTRGAALEPRLSRLTIAPSPADAQKKSLRISRDGSDVPPPAWGVAVPVDPGKHVVEASLDGAVVFHAEVEVGPTADTKTVTVVLGERAAPPPTPSPSPAAIEAPPPSTDTRKVVTWTVGGAGVVALGVGTFLGIRALAEESDSDAGCPAGRCTSAAVDANERAKSLADAATVTIAVGAAAVTVAVILWATQPSQRASVAFAPRGLRFQF